MNKLSQLVLSIILVLTFGLIAAASQKLPDDAPLIVTGQNTLLLNQLANHVGGITQLEALMGVDDDLLTSGEIALSEIFQRAIEAKLSTPAEAEPILNSSQ